MHIYIHTYSIQIHILSKDIHNILVHVDICISLSSMCILCIHIYKIYYISINFEWLTHDLLQNFLMLKLPSFYSLKA